MATFARYNRVSAKFVDHQVRVLVAHGQVQRSQLLLCGITHNDLLAQLRQSGVTDLWPGSERRQAGIMAGVPFSPSLAVVTGADSGIGRACAVALAHAGMDVGITWYRDQEGIEHTAEQVEATGRRAVAAYLDTGDVPACGDVVDELVQELGGVDVFVNNAGTSDGAPFLDMTLDQWRHTMAVDLEGAFVCMQRAARHMVARAQEGRIIAITSVHEHQPRVGAAAYDAAKHGLGGLVKTMALELGRHGITVNSVAPGEIATPMTNQEDVDPHTVERPGIPLGRPGDAREIAAVVAFLASPGSSYVTGASWPVDGGMLQMGPQAGSHMRSHDWRRP